MKLVLLLLLLTSCATKVADPVKEANDTAVVVLAPVEVVSPKPVEISNPKEQPAEHTVKVGIVSLTGFTKAQETRFKKIASNIQIMINTQEFKDLILNFKYNGKKQFISTTDSNEVVLQKVLSKDWQLEYRLERIAKKPFVALTVGYTYPTVTWIVINSIIFDSYDDADIADNIMHEYGGHKLGRYDHAQSWSESRDYSVPYGIGYGGEKLYRKMFLTK